MNFRFICAGLGLAMVCVQPAFAQHAPQGPEQPSSRQTQSLQGGDNSAWTDNAHMHAFYDLTKATLADGAAGIDFTAYRDKSYAIFRAFGTSMGMSPDGMVDHLKDIPRQLVDIVKEDPKVLDSYRNFTLALMGPE